jgi:23S rRNA pseudouridine2605 synthase
VVIREGRNREVRRLWEAAGCTVSRLIRVRYGNVELGRRLFPGVWRPLTEEETEGLLTLAGLAPRVRTGNQEGKGARASASIRDAESPQAMRRPGPRGRA